MIISQNHSLPLRFNHFLPGSLQRPFYLSSFSFCLLLSILNTSLSIKNRSQSMAHLCFLWPTSSQQSGPDLSSLSQHVLLAIQLFLKSRLCLRIWALPSMSLTPTHPANIYSKVPSQEELPTPFSALFSPWHFLLYSHTVLLVSPI